MIDELRGLKLIASVGVEYAGYVERRSADFMSAGALIDGRDGLNCPHPSKVLRAMGTAINDGMWWIDDAERTRVLMPLVFDERMRARLCIVTMEAEKERMRIVGDWAIERAATCALDAAAIALDRAGLSGHAVRMRAHAVYLRGESRIGPSADQYYRTPAGHAFCDAVDAKTAAIRSIVADGDLADVATDVVRKAMDATRYANVAAAETDAKRCVASAVRAGRASFLRSEWSTLRDELISVFTQCLDVR